MMTEEGTLTILGSGTSAGVPMIGCPCPVCHSTDQQNQRTRCSALITFRGRNILIDTSTDLRQQSLREGLARIDAVLFTHTHADHLHGIDELRVFNLRSGEEIPIYGSPATLAVIRHNFQYIFAADETGWRPRLRTEAIDGPFRLFGLEVRPLALQHGAGESLGYRFGDLAYLTDCNGIPEEALRHLGNLQTLIIDALRFRPHSTHFNISQALAVAARLQPRRTLLTHLSHDVDHVRHGRELPCGVEFAHDGQRISFAAGAP